MGTGFCKTHFGPRWSLHHRGYHAPLTQPDLYAQCCVIPSRSSDMAWSRILGGPSFWISSQVRWDGFDLYDIKYSWDISLLSYIVIFQKMRTTGSGDLHDCHLSIVESFLWVPRRLFRNSKMDAYKNCQPYLAIVHAAGLQQCDEKVALSNPSFETKIKNIYSIHRRSTKVRSLIISWSIWLPNQFNL